MKFNVGDRVVIVRTYNLSGNLGEYYHGSSTDNVELQSSGEVTNILCENDILLRLENGGTWHVHPKEISILGNSEAQIAKLNEVLPGLGKIARHPIFEIAEHAPVFVVGKQVYSIGDGKVSDKGDLFEQGIKLIKKPLVKVGDLSSLDSLVLDRAQPDIERIGKAYAQDAQKNLKGLKSSDEDLDIPQLIYKQVFPYLQEENYKDRVSELLGIKYIEKVIKKNKRLPKATKKLEEIAKNALTEVNNLISQIEQEGKELRKRNSKQNELDTLLGYQKARPYSGGSLFGKALNGKNIAIIKGIVYDLVAGSKDKEYVQIGGKKFSLIKKEKPQKFETGARVRIRKSSQYAYQNEGIGTIQGKFVNEWANVKFDSGYSNSYRKQDLKFAEEGLETKLQSLQDLENKFLIELGKKVKIDALKKHLSKDNIIDLLRTQDAQDAELLSIAGKREYDGNGYGFIQDSNGRYYAYLEVPAFAIKSVEDGNYYLYDKTNICIRVTRKERDIAYRGDVYMEKNNGHPYVHGHEKRFAEICQGSTIMPTSGKDEGEVIAKRLRRCREMLMFGYAWEYFDPVIEGAHYNKKVSKYRRKLSELQRRGIPIISKEGLEK